MIERFHASYGEKVIAPGGNTETFAIGNCWREDRWPRLDYIKSSSIGE